MSFQGACGATGIRQPGATCYIISVVTILSKLRVLYNMLNTRDKTFIQDALKQLETQNTCPMLTQSIIQRYRDILHNEGAQWSSFASCKWHPKHDEAGNITDLANNENGGVTFILLAAFLNNNTVQCHIEVVCDVLSTRQKGRQPLGWPGNDSEALGTSFQKLGKWMRRNNDYISGLAERNLCAVALLHVAPRGSTDFGKIINHTFGVWLSTLCAINQKIVGGIISIHLMSKTGRGETRRDISLSRHAMPFTVCHTNTATATLQKPQVIVCNWGNCYDMLKINSHNGKPLKQLSPKARQAQNARKTDHDRFVEKLNARATQIINARRIAGTQPRITTTPPWRLRELTLIISS